MTPDEVIEMARQAGMYQDLNVSFNQSIQNFAKLVDAKATARERVACFDAAFDAHATTAVLEAIRARGEA